MNENMQDNEKTAADFESKLAELKKIVGRLESEISLEESIKLFEDGLALTKQCIDELGITQKLIDELQGKLDLIISQGVGDDD